MKSTIAILLVSSALTAAPTAEASNKLVEDYLNQNCP